MIRETKGAWKRIWASSSWWRGPILGGIIIWAVATAAACPPPPDGSTPTQGAATPSPTPVATSSRTATPTATPDHVTLPQLTVASVPDGVPSYDRSEWHHWIDEDGDCQDTRQEVLIEESLIEVTFTDTSECRVASGRWIDPYTGTEVTNPSSLDIDHMVPLANAHSSGGWAWDADRKEAYANYLGYDGHLIAVTASANRSKGGKGPEEWMPPDEAYWCEYAVDWINVKAEWNLTATPAEWGALLEIVDECPTVDISEEDTQSPTPTPTPVPPSPTPTPPDGLPECVNTDCDCSDFSTWAEAKEVFDAFPGDPFGLDGSDNDGIPCESLPGAP